MPTYYLENILEEPIRSYHRNLVNQIAEKFPALTLTKEQGLDAHFTLKYQFDTDNIAEVENLVRKFADTHKKMPVRIGGFNNFNGQTIFVKVDASEQARVVFAEFIKELKGIAWMPWDKVDGPDLHFHTTVAQKCGDLGEEVLEFLKGKEQYFETNFSNITILQEEGITPNNVSLWKPVKTFELQ